ncbi:hypothetical protein ACFV27_27040 [Streptomyces antimycoticus]|uniref:Dioxygenase n=1 Tax=Streptomyces antimycoticus TaxID=68175 RepID=A0ABD5J442_9ACTN|nr:MULTISPECIES: hypothetical protein [Streptomyces]MEE4582754.1 hypothetical protein [Streptomyces sp. DSM 41602]QTI90099.1 hypothetical protein AS97_57785 [Streptomyces sp. AgN23]WJD95082.1 hypothetical protein QR300_03250 [Streptomyces antimycoticus]WTB03305.1 hypothetical protein OG546_03120 [Streptomyces antimycoticus]
MSVTSSPSSIDALPAARDVHARFVDISGQEPEPIRPWAPVKISRARIEAEIERLASLPRPANGRRGTLIVHPDAVGLGPGLAPGVDVTIDVLKPGERTTPLRRNTGQVEIGISGRGVVHVVGRSTRMERWDVCSIPSMKGHYFENDGDELWVRLSYSNAPLLAKLGVLYSEPLTDEQMAAGPNVLPSADRRPERYIRETAPDIELNDSGARLRGYEYLVDIEVVENNPLHWAWNEVREHLSWEEGDGKRTIMALYNPATERRNGATHSFFVTASSMPPGVAAQPLRRGHRHSSVAINYHFLGSGKSVVEGHVVDWSAGDLLLSAPGWSEHDHYHGPDGFGVFTVQDHPLHIGMESLIWQEKMSGPILALGSEAGQTGYVGPRTTGA